MKYILYIISFNFFKTLGDRYYFTESLNNFPKGTLRLSQRQGIWILEYLISKPLFFKLYQKAEMGGRDGEHMGQNHQDPKW